MTPTPGRIVHYCLTEADAKSTAIDSYVWNEPGDLCALLVTKSEDGRVSGHVFVSGPNPTLWVADVSLGAGVGQWHWPERV